HQQRLKQKKRAERMAAGGAVPVGMDRPGQVTFWWENEAAQQVELPDGKPEAAAESKVEALRVKGAQSLAKSSAEFEERKRKTDRADSKWCVVARVRHSSSLC